MGDNQHILLAVDFATETNQIATQALYWSKLLNARLSIIHVLDNIPMPDTTYGTRISLEKDNDDALLSAEQSKLLKIADFCQVEMADCWFIWGVPATEISYFAKQHQVSLIVLGSHAKHGLGLVFGSVANSVLHQAHCDVLAVRVKPSQINP
ncbi:MAG: universal stress protein [Methylococcaceae bacterium]|jgi:universal stress protein A